MSVCYCSPPCPVGKTTELLRGLDTPTDRDPSPTQTPHASVTPPAASLLATPTAAPPTATPPVSPSTEVASPVLCWEEGGLDRAAVQQQQEVSGASTCVSGAVRAVNCYGSDVMVV